MEMKSKVVLGVYVAIAAVLVLIVPWSHQGSFQDLGYRPLFAGPPFAYVRFDEVLSNLIMLTVIAIIVWQIAKRLK